MRAEPVRYDPFSWEIHADPYPIYRRLRDEAPVYRDEAGGFYALSRYADVHRALHSAVPTPHEEQIGAVGQGRARRLGHLPALRDLIPGHIQLAPALELRAEFGQPAAHGLLRVREHGDLHRRPFR